MSRGFMGVSWVFHGVFQALGTICGPGAVLGSGGACASFSQSPPPLPKLREETRAVRFHGGFMGVSWGVSGFGDDLWSRGGFGGWGRGVSGSVFLMVPNI